MSSIHDLKIRAEFTNEMLDQIRAVVREELQVVFTEVQRTLQRMEQPPILQGDAFTSEQLTERLKEWKPMIHVTYDKLAPEGHQSIVEGVKRSIERDVRLNGQRQVI